MIGQLTETLQNSPIMISTLVHFSDHDRNMCWEAQNMLSDHDRQNRLFSPIMIRRQKFWTSSEIFLPLKNAYKYSFLSQTDRLTTRIILYQTQTLLRAFLCAKTDSFLLEWYHWFIFDIRSSKDTLFLFFQISHCIQTFMLYLGSVWSLKLRERVSSSFVSYLREFYSQD